MGALAQAAGVSKAGVQYQNHGKAHMLETYVAERLEDLADGLRRRATAHPGAEAATLQAVLDQLALDRKRPDMAAALAIAFSSGMSSPCRALLADALRRLLAQVRGEGPDPTVGVGVIAGAFGLLVAESFGLFVLDAEERGDLLALWRDLASGAAPIPTAEHLP